MECLACESVCESKISPLEIPRLPEELSDSVEQTALIRANSTMLMNVMCEKVTNEQEALKNAERQAGEKKRDKIDERHVLDETVGIVEDGSRRQRLKFPEKRNESERQGQGQW